MLTHTTGEREQGPSVVVPLDCITASALRSLATTLDRIAAFHSSRGGACPDVPCLTTVIVEEKTVSARVKSGDKLFLLRFENGAWHFA